MTEPAIRRVAYAAGAAAVAICSAAIGSALAGVAPVPTGSAIGVGLAAFFSGLAVIYFMLDGMYGDSR